MNGTYHVHVLYKYEISHIFTARPEKFKQTKKKLCPLTSSPHTAHCISALFINQTSPTGRKARSTIKSNTVLTSMTKLFKRSMHS